MTTQDTAGPLLETRLYIPRLRRGLVARPALSERLSRGAASKLTLISAPAGFGKTTLLAEFARRAMDVHPDLVVAQIVFKDREKTPWENIINIGGAVLKGKSGGCPSCRRRV